MSYTDWAITIATVSVSIIASFATDGVALIAKIALALKSAYHFTEKLKNLKELDARKSKL